MKNDLQGMTLPTCDIMVNGQKRKLYGKKKNKVYLHNGDNFQLKFFNPLQERIGVQLCMNGQKVDNDLLVINPGQEITIERYIGTNRKLTFSAYDIDTSKMSEERVKEAKKAIEKNGILEVVFWNEKKPAPVIYTTSTTVYPNYIPIDPNPDWFRFDTGTPLTTPYYTQSNISGATISTSPMADMTISATDVIINGNLKINGSIDINNGQLTITSNTGTSGTSGSSGASGTSGHSGTSGTPGYPVDSILFSDTTFSSIDFAPQEMSRGIVDSTRYKQSSRGFAGQSVNSSSLLSKKIETGRIEKGGVSNQYFSPIAFEIGEPFYKIKFKLLPFSLKPVKKKLYDSTTIKNVIENNTYIKSESSIREYCKCGYRISRGKGTWDFCPRCGRKIKK